MQVETARRAGRRRRWGPWLLALPLAGVAAYHAVALVGRASGGKRAPAARPRPVSVVAAAATREDMGVYLTGLGAATALNTVTVRTRVDGQLVEASFREGQSVRRGDVLARIDPRPFQVQLAQAEGQKAKDEAALKDARLDLQRYQVLVQEDSAPRQQLDAQAAAVHQLEAALQTDQGQIDAARLNLTYSRIEAPASGVVGLRLVDPGNIVHASDPGGIVVITQVEPIAVVFTIPADQVPEVLAAIRAGRRLDVEAYDRDIEKRLAVGSLLAVDNQIDPATGTLKMKALFANQDRALFPNQFLNARLLVRTLRDAVVVPSAALQRSPRSTFVYVVEADGTVEPRDVQVQLTEGDRSAIGRGVSAGERVVVDGLDRLQPGMRVTATVDGGANGAAQAAP